VDQSIVAQALTRVGRFDLLLDGLDKGDINPLDKNPDNGNTALHAVIKSVSTQHTHIKTLRSRALREMLVIVKGNCSPQNGCQETPLHIAISCFRLDMVLMLIEAGANLSLRDNLERTPLDLAQELEEAEVVAAIQRALSGGLEDNEEWELPPIDETLDYFGRLNEHT
jgi:hypothetical protein